MRLSTIVFGISVMLGGVAAAQPTEPGTGTTDVNPQPPPPPPPPPQPPVEHSAPVIVSPESSVRPSELAFAIGLGYLRAPGGALDLQTPNIASVRVRLPTGLTFEPTISIANSSTDNDMLMTQATDTTTDLSLGTLARLPVISHRNVDFEVLGNLNFGVNKVNPEGDYNTRTTTTFNLGWGIAIGYWITHHWQLSASATNPLVGYTSIKTQTGPTTENKVATTSFEVTFDPTIFVMLHLYN